MKQTNKEDLKILRIVVVVVLMLKIGLHKSKSVKGALPVFSNCSYFSEIVLYV